DRHFNFAAAASHQLADVAEELARAVFPRAVEREFAAGIAGNLQRVHAGAAEVLVQNPDGALADHVLRTGDRKGGDRNPARQRLELHDAERVGAAREYEDVRCREVRGQDAIVQRAEKFRLRKTTLEDRLVRPGADDDFGAG